MPQRPLKKRITCSICRAEFYPHEKWEIYEEKLLLAEGVDVHRFLIYACKAYQKSDIQVISFGGNIGLPVPSEPFQFQHGDGLKTAFMLFPGPDRNNQCQTGTIEDLCLATISKDPLPNCVKTFLECAEQSQEGDEKLKHPWKSKLYAYLAGKDDHAGKRLSQAAKNNVWNWGHDAMLPFRRIIQEM